MLKHYLSGHLKKGNPEEYNRWIEELDIMTLEALATKICESLGLSSAPSLSVGAPEKSAGSRRRRRPRKMNSRKKHLNKRTHKTINARTSKPNTK
jgi:hypothetical protein